MAGAQANATGGAPDEGATADGDALRSLREILEAVRGLAKKLDGVERTVAANEELLEAVVKRLEKLDAKVARAKQVKRIKKFLDQVELVDVGPQDS